MLKEAGITPVYLVDRAAPPACLFEDGLAQPAYAKKGYRGKRPLLTLVDSGGNTAACYFHFKRVLAAHKEQQHEAAHARRDAHRYERRGKQVAAHTPHQLRLLEVWFRNQLAYAYWQGVCLNNITQHLYCVALACQ